MLIDSDRRRQFAERLHLATQLMVESKQKHGRVIIERYTLVLHLLQTNKECVYYELGRYYESLYTDAQEKRSLHDNNNKSTTTTGGQNSTSRSNNNNNTNNNNSNSSVAVSFEDSSRYITKAISHYITCLQSNQSTMITQALPRMLTLWFSFTATSTSTSTTSSTGSTTNTNNTGSNTNNTSAGSGNSGDSVHLAKAQKAINEEVKKLATNPFVCFHCLPQLVSRLGMYICTYTCV